MPVINPLTRQQWYTLSGAVSDFDLGERLKVNELLAELYGGSVAVPTEDDDEGMKTTTPTTCARPTTCRTLTPTRSSRSRPRTSCRTRTRLIGEWTRPGG
jgi:hypothetical protein